MSTRQEDEARWRVAGASKGAAYVIVVCDTFEYENYPVYVMPDESLPDKLREHHEASMQAIEGVMDIKHGGTILWHKLLIASMD